MFADLAGRLAEEIRDVMREDDAMVDRPGIPGLAKR
jgi:hypothetical protein